jgi:hypothetical protein
MRLFLSGTPEQDSICPKVHVSRSSLPAGKTTVFKNNRDDIYRAKTVLFMHRARDTTSGKLIIAVVCLFLLVAPGAVSAAVPSSGVDVLAAPGANGAGIIPDLPVPPVFLSRDNASGIEPNITIVPTTPVPPVFMVIENATGAVNPPPLLIFDTPVIENLTCTVYGIAEPGSGNVTITSIFWDWGDSPTLEYHGFPI